MAGVNWDSSAVDTIRRRVARGVDEAAVNLQAAAKQTLSRPGRGDKPDVGFRVIGGKVVPLEPNAEHGVKAARYPPSLPGDPPTVQTGTLRRSVQVDRSEIEARNPKAAMGTGRRYGFYLEFGTRRVEARPWMRPTFAQHGEEARMTIEQSLHEGILEIRGV